MKHFSSFSQIMSVSFTVATLVYGLVPCAGDKGPLKETVHIYMSLIDTEKGDESVHKVTFSVKPQVAQSEELKEDIRPIKYHSR